MDDKSIIPYNNKKSFEVGDGKTRIAHDWEQPKTGQEKHQPSFEEVTHNLEVAIGNFMFEAATVLDEPFRKLFDFVTEAANIIQEANVDSEAVARHEIARARKHATPSRPFDPDLRRKKGRRTYR